MTVEGPEAVGVATAATVLSNSGVVVYNIRSDAKDTLENGRFVVEVALGKASLSDAGAFGFKEARSKSSGFNTLTKDSPYQQLKFMMGDNFRVQQSTCR